jgi:hypothetical protein
MCSSLYALFWSGRGECVCTVTVCLRSDCVFSTGDCKLCDQCYVCVRWPSTWVWPTSIDLTIIYSTGTLLTCCSLRLLYLHCLCTKRRNKTDFQEWLVVAYPKTKHFYLHAKVLIGFIHVYMCVFIISSVCDSYFVCVHFVVFFVVVFLFKFFSSVSPC